MAKSSGDSNKSRVLTNHNDRYLQHALVTDLLIPLFKTAKILEGNPPRNTNKNTVTILQKNRHLQTKIRHAREEIAAGLDRWNDKYERPIKEQISKRKIIAEQEKLKTLSKGLKVVGTDSALKSRLSNDASPTKPSEIKLSRHLLSLLELLDEFYDEN